MSSGVSVRPVSRRIPYWLRYWGLFVGGTCMITGGWSLLLVAVFVMYFGMPTSRPPGEVLGPMFDVLSFAMNPLVIGVIVLSLGVFLIDVSENGVLNLDDRSYKERKKDLRRKKARESEAWELPEEDKERPSEYEKLREEQKKSGLYLHKKQFTMKDGGKVRGVVRNGGNMDYYNVKVVVRFIDEDGEQIGDSRLAAKKKLRGRETWTFEVFCREEARPVSYRVSDPRGDREDEINL